MAKDYAKRAPKKKSESKTRRKGSKGGSQVFGFFRMLKGLCLLSLIMMSGFYLSHQFGERLSAWLFPEETSSEHARALNGHETQFEFYNILPKKQASQVVDKSQQSALVARKEDTTVEQAGKFLMQVASFRQLSDADRLKAELILKGFDAKIVPFHNEQQTWYRVKIGPFASLSSVKRARIGLEEMGLNGLIQRIA